MAFVSMSSRFQNPRLIFSVYAVLAVVLSLHRYSLGRGANGYTSYENYLIFKNSFTHLLQGTNIYTAFPAEQWDLFKYSPAFALGMAPFSFLNDALGLSCWNLLNATVFLFGLWQIKVLDERQRAFCSWFLLPELIVSLQNSQSNGLTAGLLLLAWSAFEKGKNGSASAFIAGSAFVKIFGVLAAGFALFYPRLRTSLTSLVLWCLALAAAPFIFFPTDYVVRLYIWWWELLRADHSASIGLSVSGWLQSWFGWTPPKILITATGFLAMAVFMGKHRYTAQTDAVTRGLFWSALLIWLVIFNHKAESPTFIIALTGVAIRYCLSEKNRMETALLWICFALSSISPTDLFPRALREAWVQPYVLKAVPFIFVWGWILWRLAIPKKALP